MASGRGYSFDSQPARFGRRHNFFHHDNQAHEDQYLFTSLRYDASTKNNKLNPFCCKVAKSTYLFKYHYERLRDAAGNRGWHDAQKCLKRPVDLHNRLVHAVETYEQKTGAKGPYKVRITLKYHGYIEIAVAPDLTPHKNPLLYPTTLELFRHPHDAAARHSNYKVVLDALPTNRTIHTKSKTEYRSMYDYARLSAGIQSFQDAKEVLLFNSDGESMDASITTPYFYRNGEWVGPAVPCGGQMSVTRRWAVEQGLCPDGVVDVNSLRHDEIIWLSNAVKGFFTARFVSQPDQCKAPSFSSRNNSVASFAPTAVDDVADTIRSKL